MPTAQLWRGWGLLSGNPTALTASLTSPEDRSLLKTEDENFQQGNLHPNSYYAGAADMPLFPGCQFDKIIAEFTAFM